MQKKPIGIRIIFMGTSDFADTILKSLLANDYNIISVYTQSDKKTGRKQVFKKTAVKKTAELEKIPFFSPAKFDDSAIAQLKLQKPDLIIVAAYGKILPKKVLTLAGFGAINIHASLLPSYRGPSPIQNAILNGDTETGITIMLMDSGIDTGAILSQKKLIIHPAETCHELSSRLANLSTELLNQTIPLWMERKITPIPQNNSLSSLCQLIERQDGQIIWSDSAQEIYDRYRAFFSWPGIFTYWEKTSLFIRIKLSKIDFQKNNSNEIHHIGEVFLFKEKLSVQTGQGIIFLKMLQREGKTDISAKDFLNGNPDFIGSILK